MNFNTEQIICTIKAMRKQEEYNGYTVTDYLAELPIMMMTDTTTASTATTAAAAAAAVAVAVDASCRFVMAKWADTVCNYCNYNKETVEIALSILDRFVATEEGQCILYDRHLYQLAAMTCLYTSIKINEEEIMDLNTVQALSRGVHTTESITSMEYKILSALQWKVHPPTSMSFVRQILSLVSSDHISDSIREIIINETKNEIELLINEYNFVTYNASIIAFACILNAIEENIMNDGGEFYDKFETIISNILEIDVCCVQDLRIEIQEFVLDTKIYSTSSVVMRDASDTTTTTKTTTKTINNNTATNININNVNDNDNDNDNDNGSSSCIISGNKDNSRNNKNKNGGGGGFYSSPRAVTTTSNDVIC
jgi:hypothetical protein